MTTGRSPHRWVLRSARQRSEGSVPSDRMRIFVCERCGAGPILKDIFSPKGSIASVARRQGFSADCNHEVVKRLHEGEDS